MTGSFCPGTACPTGAEGSAVWHRALAARSAPEIDANGHQPTRRDPGQGVLAGLAGPNEDRQLALLPGRGEPPEPLEGQRRPPVRSGGLLRRDRELVVRRRRRIDE